MQSTESVRVLERAALRPSHQCSGWYVALISSPAARRAKMVLIMQVGFRAHVQKRTDYLLFSAIGTATVGNTFDAAAATTLTTCGSFFSEPERPKNKPHTWELRRHGATPCSSIHLGSFRSLSETCRIAVAQHPAKQLFKSSRPLHACARSTASLFATADRRLLDGSRDSMIGRPTALRTNMVRPSYQLQVRMWHSHEYPQCTPPRASSLAGFTQAGLCYVERTGRRSNGERRGSLQATGQPGRARPSEQAAEDAGRQHRAVRFPGSISASLDLDSNPDTRSL